MKKKCRRPVGRHPLRRVVAVVSSTTATIVASAAKNVESRLARPQHSILQGHLLSPNDFCVVNFARETPVIPTGEHDSFCLYGEIDYTDIHGLRWRTNFCWVYGDDGAETHFMPHHSGNNEEPLGKDTET